MTLCKITHQREVVIILVTHLNSDPTTDLLTLIPACNRQNTMRNRSNREMHQPWEQCNHSYQPSVGHARGPPIAVQIYA